MQPHAGLPPRPPLPHSWPRAHTPRRCPPARGHVCAVLCAGCQAGRGLDASAPPSWLPAWAGWLAVVCAAARLGGAQAVRAGCATAAPRLAPGAWHPATRPAGEATAPGAVAQAVTGGGWGAACGGRTAGRRCIAHAAACGLTLAHGALHVAHDEAVLVVQELHAHLGDLHHRTRPSGEHAGRRKLAKPGCALWRALPRPHLTTRAGAADNLHHNGKLGGLILQARKPAAAHEARCRSFAADTPWPP
jgi:hypothetical protein